MNMMNGECYKRDPEKEDHEAEKSQMRQMNLNDSKVDLQKSLDTKFKSY